MAEIIAEELCASDLTDGLSRLRAIIDVTTERPRSLDDAIPELLDRLRDVFGTDTATVLLPSGEDGFEVLASCGLGDHVEARVRVPSSSPTIRRFVDDPGPSLVALSDVDDPYSRSLRASGLRTLLGAPLRVGDTVCGVVHVGCTDNRSFSDADRAVFGAVAEWMALTLDRASLVRAEQAARGRAERDSERLRYLAAASRELGPSVDEDELFETLARWAVAPGLADWAVVDVVAETGVVHRRVVVANAPEIEAGLDALAGTFDVWPFGERIRDAFAAGVPIVFDDVSDATLHDLMPTDAAAVAARLAGAGSAATVPVEGRAGAVAQLVLVRRQAAEPFTFDDVGLCQELARRAGLAVENARLLAALRHAESYHRQLATTLQASLLPPHLPEFPGVELAALYQPSGEGADVGGDFYDLFHTQRSTWAVVIGDVRGRGPEAAAITALARYTLRASAMTARKPQRVLAALNDALLRHDGDEIFCTAVYATFTPQRHGGLRVEAASGGHPAPLVVRANGDVEDLVASGTLLGVVDAAAFPSRHSTIGPGDAVIFFTDGVTEARYQPDGARLELFGDDRLRTVAATCTASTAADIVARVQTAIADFSAGAPHDDVAIVVVRVPTRQP